MVAAERPDVILLDIRLPDFGRVGVCDEVRCTTDVPILMLTVETALSRVLG
jgi:two-component system OmpR family response regulator